MAAHEALSDFRRKEIEGIYKDYPLLFPILLAVLGVIIGIQIGGIVLPDKPGYITGLYTDGLSIFTTVFILDTLARRREDQRRIKDLQEQLVRDAGSLVKDVAVNAVHQMHKHGWLKGDKGLLKGADLTAANLEGAFLEDANLKRANLPLAILERVIIGEANLEETNLSSVNLKRAALWETNLEGAYLQAGNLERAYLQDVNLKGADLQFADLEGANLRNVNLEGTNMRHANLQGAILFFAKFDENTTLPDDSKWTPDTDMNHFIAPQHPDFWRSNAPASPAYPGYKIPTNKIRI